MIFSASRLRKEIQLEKEQLTPYINELKTRLEEYLIKKVPGYRHGKNFKCLNPAHDDQNPSMTFSSKFNTCHCFSCNVTYDIIHLLAMDYSKNCSNKKEFLEIVYQGCKDFGIYIPEQKFYSDKKPNYRNGEKYFNECHKKVSHTKYYEKRGIGIETINRFNLGFDPNYPISKNRYIQAAIIPRGTNAYTARNVSPNAEKEDRYRKQGNAKSTFFNIKALDNDMPIFIVEGEFDALSIIEVGYEAIALGSVDNYLGFVEICKEKQINVPLFICLDNDIVGQKISSVLVKELKMLDLKAEEVNISLGFKDANEALVKDREKFKAGLETILKNYYEKEESMNLLKALNQVILLYPKEKWEILGEALLLVSELPDTKQEQIYEFIKNIHSQNLRKEHNIV